MSIFDDRERAFEQAFIKNEEARFRALALRNRMLGEWAAERLALTGDAFSAYVETVSRSITAEPTDDRLATMIISDLQAHGFPDADKLVRETMVRLLGEAQQLLGVTKT